MEEFKASVFRKVTIRLIPFLILAYLLNYIDRVNLGFAALQMNRDLGLTATTFGYGAGILFIGYFLFGVPSNMGLQKYGAAEIWSENLVRLTLICMGLYRCRDGFYH